MNKSSMINILSGLVIILMLSSCVSKRGKIRASYVIPPDKVQNVNDINTIMIKKPEIKIKGNYLTNKDVPNIQNFVQRKISSDLYREGFYRVGDILWGNGESVGLKNIQGVFKEQEYPHGFNLLSTPTLKVATLELTVNAEINRQQKLENRQQKLVRTPYIIKRKKGTPFSVPDLKNTTSKTVTYKVKINDIISKASLKVVLKDKNGKVVYQKVINGGQKKFKLGGTAKPAPIPTAVEIIAETLSSGIDQVIKDISPHYVTRELVINEDGNKKAVLLLKALAYSEAIKVLSEVIEKTEKPSTADLENMGIALEVTGNYEDAEYFFAESVKQDKKNNRAAESLQRIRDMRQAKTKLRRQDIEKTNKYETKDFKEH